ncbi:uncharacterized protein LOC111519597 [Drosophila willistoni]|uniref:uncharacterized protein LOC111519597 n=1 Tax=Drosophila willistoni TaxID=7260 RepID=UPI000C26CDF1|nr:uncharacterized protein LOC111519597 [Drosophila willistoni]
MENRTVANLEVSSEESKTDESEISLIVDGFDLINVQCEGNCYQKIRSILQQAANTIKLKDRQIDNLIMALNKNSDDKSYTEITLKYDNQLKEANTLLQESFSLIKSLEAQNQQVEDRLAAAVNENDVLIKSYEMKIKELEEKIKTNETAVKERKRFLWYSDRTLVIENDIAGPGWIVICRYGRFPGQTHMDDRGLFETLQYEVYIDRVHTNGGTSYAHFDNFERLSRNNISEQLVKSLTLISSSIKIDMGSISKMTLDELNTQFSKDCKSYTLMVKPKNVQLMKLDPSISLVMLSKSLR